MTRGKREDDQNTQFSTTANGWTWAEPIFTCDLDTTQDRGKHHHQIKNKHTQTKNTHTPPKPRCDIIKSHSLPNSHRSNKTRPGNRCSSWPHLKPSSEPLTESQNELGLPPGSPHHNRIIVVRFQTNPWNSMLCFYYYTIFSKPCPLLLQAKAQVWTPY